jgi:hypothetical protein
LSTEIFAFEKGFAMASVSGIAHRRIVGYIFRTWVTRKDGKRDYAKDHGLKAWRIPVFEK